MQRSLATYLVSALGGAVVAVIVLVAGVSSFQSASANQGANRPPSDLSQVNYADE